MAKIANTFVTSESIGNREDLADQIWRVAVEKTPFLRAIGDTKVSAVSTEWQTDDLRAAAADNAHLEGDETSYNAITPTVRLNNVCQILKESAIVSDTQEAISKAGRNREMGYQIAKKTKELTRDLETSLLANVAKSTAEPRRLAGLGAWVTTNTVFEVGNGGADPTGDGSDARTDDGTPVAFAEADLRDLVRQVYTSGGDPDVLMVGPFNKQAVSQFSGRATEVNNTDSAKRIYDTIDVYESDFGSFQVMPNIFQRERDAWLLDIDLWKLGVLRPLYHKPQASTGDAEKRMIVMECTLIARNEKGSGLRADLTGTT